MPAEANLIKDLALKSEINAVMVSYILNHVYTTEGVASRTLGGQDRTRSNDNIYKLRQMVFPVPLVIPVHVELFINTADANMFFEQLLKMILKIFLVYTQ